jgi:phosphohistidine phosphatase SixA
MRVHGSGSRRRRCDLRMRATLPFGSWARAPLLLLVATWLWSAGASAQQLSGTNLTHALQQGGYVIVVRNGRAAAQPPKDERSRAPANLTGERELDESGQGQMGVIGYVFRELAIPVGKTLTSPAFRSRQSGNYFGLGEQMMVDDLAEDADPASLSSHVRELPPQGQNTVIVTHGALIAKALGREARDLDVAETLIYRPAAGGAQLVARLKVEDWAKLAVK